MQLVQSAGLKELQEKHSGYRVKYDQLVRNLKNLAPGELKAAYRSEYSSWSNRKHWAKKNGVLWSGSMNTFAEFLLVNGPIPEKSWTLDRINSQGPYTLDNIRWASKGTQSQNRSSVHAIVIRGVTYSLTEIARRTRKTYDAIRMGFRRKGNQYIAKVIAKTDAMAVPSVESLWQFPVEGRSWLELEYSERYRKDQNRIRFFLEFTRSEFDRLGFAASIATNPINQKQIREDIAEVRKHHNEAVAYVNDILIKERCKELEARLLRFGPLQLPIDGRDMDDPAACPPYCPY